MARVLGWWPLSGRVALVALALSWTAGAVLLIASWRSAVAQDRILQAPVCSESQWFTPAECTVTLTGTITSLTSSRAEMRLGRQHVAADVSLSGEIPDVRGELVRVTLYRGEVMHIRGQGLKIDTDSSPVSSHTNFLAAGLFCIVGGGLLVGANVLTGRSLAG